MFFDTSHNTRHAVLANVYTAFVETATKMWAYARCLGSASAVPARSAAGAGAGANGSSSRRPAAAAAMPGTPLLIDTIRRLINVAFLLLASRSRKLRNPGYSFAVDKAQLAWLATVACRQVLVKKQTGYGKVIAWLEQQTRKLSGHKDVDCVALVRVVKAAAASSAAGVPAKPWWT
ncbi:hypothetical protein B0T24DRAFT_30167 [Lasiosphaeria ovina]|uniref:Telomerase reverse transcriptase n=1 Tax=Lasiosphaeria ovina TaxID=92902 RepID=A0AAE0NK62_9PEZI|nr:hypothetical protein B0T24DRAFT_30167 [Lasiosphaeria ovina]